MDVGLERLQPFLVGDSEMLLLVDNDEAQPLELDALGKERMGADDDVDRAVRDAFLGLLGLGRRDQPRQPPDFHREALKPLDEILVMLPASRVVDSFSLPWK